MNDSFNIDRSPFVCSGAYLPFYERPSRRYIVWYAPTLYRTDTLIPFHTNGSLSGEQRFVIREVSDWIQFISSKSIYANKSCDLQPAIDQPCWLTSLLLAEDQWLSSTKVLEALPNVKFSKDMLCETYTGVDSHHLPRISQTNTESIASLQMMWSLSMTCFPHVSLRNRQLFLISNPNPVKVTHPIHFKSRSHFQPWSNSHDLHLSFPYHSYQGIRINHTMEPKVPPPQSLSLLQTDPRRRWSHRQSPHHGLREIWNWLNQNYKRVLLNPTPYSLET